jgi:hypothetical protein
MWTHVQKIWKGAAEGENALPPPVVPLRKQEVMRADITPGKTLRFAATCPLSPLSGARAAVIGMRHYQFGEDRVTSYQLKVGGTKHYYLTVAEDDEGSYLAISRQLNEAEQDQWFGRDALGFFTEASSAKSIRCKADLMIEGEWAAARYGKTVDWVEGSVNMGESARLLRSMHYSLLVNDMADKALEIEHDDASGENRILITVYRPMSDITSVEPTREAELAANDDVPLFRDPTLTLHAVAPAAPSLSPAAQAAETATPQPKQRPDFRRIEDNAPIHIERTPPNLIRDAAHPVSDLPSFLLPKEGNYLALDQVLPPEAERIRVGMFAARNLIDLATQRGGRIRDVLRDLIGLQSALSEEVIFELPLSDEDYRTLAMRYKLRPDHRIEIRARLEEELRQKLSAVAKP